VGKLWCRNKQSTGVIPSTPVIPTTDRKSVWNRGVGKSDGVRILPAITQSSKTAAITGGGVSRGVSQSLRSFDMTGVEGVTGGLPERLVLKIKAQAEIKCCRMNISVFHTPCQVGSNKITQQTRPGPKSEAPDNRFFLDFNSYM